MSVRRRATYAWLGALLMWALVLGPVLIDQSPVHSVWAQGAKPTAPPQEQPTKSPVEPQPTKEQIAPTAVPPTKEPLPTMASTRAPTKTPWPTLLPTKTSLPTLLPTKTLLPTSPATATATDAAIGSTTTGAATNTPFSQSEASRAVVGSSAGTASPSVVSVATPAMVSGTVFDDRNDNGQRDPDEPGLAGVAVSVITNGELKPTVTDARGVYTLPTLAGATVRISVPAGWNTRQADSRPIELVGDFPLYAVEAASSHQPTLTPLTITQSVIDLAPLIALGVGLGVVMAFGFLRTARAVSTSNRALALLFVRMQRTSERPLTFESDGLDRATNARVLTLLNQAGLDATGQPLNIDRVLSVTAGDHPAIIALGQDGRAAFVVFTPMETKAFQRALRTSPESNSSEVAFEHATAYPLGRLGEVLTAGHARACPLDALNSGLFVADDLAAAHAYLASDLPVSARTLPRTARWTLFVAPLPRHDLAVRSGWRQRTRRRLHH